MGISRISDKDRKKAIDWLVEGNSREDLADQLIDHMSVIELKELMKEIEEDEDHERNS
jgi:hypothetical protein